MTHTLPYGVYEFDIQGIHVFHVGIFRPGQRLFLSSMTTNMMCRKRLVAKKETDFQDGVGSDNADIIGASKKLRMLVNVGHGSTVSPSVS